MILLEFCNRYRLQSLCYVLLCSAYLGLVLSASFETAPKVYQHPEIGVPYIVDVVDEQAQFDISLDEESDLFLVVSSLGEYRQEFSIECSRKPIAEPTLNSWTLIVPLDVERKSRHGGSIALPSLDESHSRGRGDGDAKSRRDKLCGSLDDTCISKREFFLHVTEGDLSDPNQYVGVDAIEVGEGKYVRVYLDRQESRNNIAFDLVDEIIRIFDDEIVPDSKDFYGQCRDIDGDGKFTILLSPWLGRLSGGKVSLGGFVRSSDFQTRTNPPFGNRCDMMYLNSTLTSGLHLKALLAHEYAHAVAFGIRSQPDSHCGSLPVEEDWLNEAIAHLSENYHDAGWSNIDHRVDAFLKNTSVYPLVVPDYYRAGMWRNHGCRGVTFLFLRWCVDRFGWQLIPRLMNSNSRGIDNVTACTGLTFAELYRRFCISMMELAVDPTTVETNGSIDFHSRLGRYDLHGPNVIDWNIVKQDRRNILLKGTTTAYLRIPAMDSTNTFRISLKAQPGTKLQVTVVKRKRLTDRRIAKPGSTEDK